MRINMFEEALIHAQNLGLEINELKRKGISVVPIESYGLLLDNHVEILRHLSVVYSSRIGV